MNEKDSVITDDRDYGMENALLIAIIIRGTASLIHVSFIKVESVKFDVGRIIFKWVQYLLLHAFKPEWSQGVEKRQTCVGTDHKVREIANCFSI